MAMSLGVCSGSTESPAWTERAPSSPLQCGAFRIEWLSGSCRDDRLRVGGTPDRPDESNLRQRRGGAGREDEADGRQVVLGGGVLASVSEVSKPICIAKRTISLRVRRPSFSAIRARYVSTVFTLTSICFAIS